MKKQLVNEVVVGNEGREKEKRRLLSKGIVEAAIRILATWGNPEIARFRVQSFQKLGAHKWNPPFGNSLIEESHACFS